MSQSLPAPTPHIDTVLDLLPNYAGLKNYIGQLCNNNDDARSSLDLLLRFVLGLPCRDRGAPEWEELQQRLRTKFAECEHQDTADRNTPGKRPRAEDEATAPTAAKRQKVEDGTSSTPIYTLHGMTTMSPLRKKMDITITKTSIDFLNPSTLARETSVPLSSLSRAILVGNMGKNKTKPHWTVVLLSDDLWDVKRERADKRSGTENTQVQVIFTIESEPPATAKEQLTTTTHPDAPVVFSKGKNTLEPISTFLRHLPAHVTVVDGSSAARDFLNSKNGYLEVYRAAKEGTLHFLDTGIAWTGNKPCEFFALEDIAPDDSVNPLASGVKTFNSSGRRMTVFVRRKAHDDGTEGEEVEFTVLDPRDPTPLTQWIKAHKHLFGKPPLKANGANGKDNGKGGATTEDIDPPAPADDKSDASDEDFVADSDSDGGSATSSNSGTEQGSGDGVSDGEGDAVESEDGDGDDDDDEMDADRHPLLRPGAVPRLSKAAINAVVGMMEQDLGLATESEDERDELED